MAHAHTYTIPASPNDELDMMGQPPFSATVCNGRRNIAKQQSESRARTPATPNGQADERAKDADETTAGWPRYAGELGDAQIARRVLGGLRCMPWEGVWKLNVTQTYNVHDGRVSETRRSTVQDTPSACVGESFTACPRDGELPHAFASRRKQLGAILLAPLLITSSLRYCLGKPTTQQTAVLRTQDPRSIARAGHSVCRQDQAR